MASEPELIYIAGYGRSGSTLLERLLQCQPDIQACGEMTNFFKIYGSASSRCSCGQTLDKCEFWGNVAQTLFEQGFSLSQFPCYSKIQIKREARWSHGGSLFLSRHQHMYARIMEPFLESVATQCSDNNFLVDSSKTAYTRPFRPIAISQLGKFRVRIIHLVRDPRGVVWSVKKGLNRSLEAGKDSKTLLPLTRAVAGWVYANRAAGRLQRFFGKENYCLVRYEDFVEAPVQILNRISTNWGIDLHESIRVAHEARSGSEILIPVMHQLTGNRMRFSTSFSIRPDYTWKEKLNPKTNAIVKSITMPLMKKYGYV